MPDTITVYSLEELKEQFPEAFERVHERWAESVASSGDIAWTDETMDSLRAVINACGAGLNDWSIGAYSQNCYVRVSLPDDVEELEPPEARAWFHANVLRPNGYVKANGHADFPGHCKFTGYCADDDFLQHVWERLGKGDTLKESLESLADRARELFEADLEQSQDVDSMMVNMESAKFTADGTEV